MGGESKRVQQSARGDEPSTQEAMVRQSPRQYRRPQDRLDSRRVSRQHHVLVVQCRPPLGHSQCQHRVPNHCRPQES
eukprot:4242336-Amphidinium_carterae.2